MKHGTQRVRRSAARTALRSVLFTLMELRHEAVLTERQARILGAAIEVGVKGLGGGT